MTESNLRITDVPSQYTDNNLYPWPIGPHGSSIPTPGFSLPSAVENNDRSILRDYYFTGPLNETGGGDFRSGSSVWNEQIFKETFGLCFNCHDWRTWANMEPRPYTNQSRNTNFFKGSTTSDIKNLHFRHVPVGRHACMNCHYNIHSNVEATNTQYSSSYDDGFGLGTLPPDGDTHLINFAPNKVSCRWVRTETDLVLQGTICAV